MANDKNEIQEILKNVTSNINNLELEQLKKDLRVIKYKLQEINDTLEGGLRSFNLKEYRNTYVINAQDSLDSNYPMYIHFNIIDETVRIVSIKLSFWILNYRAYSKAGTASNETVTVASAIDAIAHDGGYLFIQEAVPSSKYHTHTPQYGIYEESNSPTIEFAISQDGGVGYSSTYKGFITDQSLDITDKITSIGSKIIKFTSNTRARLSVQINVKLDIKAR